MLAMMYAIEMGESPAVIKDFATVLSSGFYNSEKQTAAVVLRNDILLGRVSAAKSSQGRVIACHCIENAINDFCRERPRKRSYIKSINPVYSNSVKFTEPITGKEK